MPVNVNDDRLLPLREARRLTGLSETTLRKWMAEGRIPQRRTPSGQRRFAISDLEDACGGPLRPGSRLRAVTVCYARVSSRRQASEGDLAGQQERLEAWVAVERAASDVEVFSDVGSGLSDRRGGLRRALIRCQAPEVSELVVEHRERLARFGVGTIEVLLAGYGCKLVEIGVDEALSESAESELVRDMLAVVTSLSGRLYGQRSAKARSLQACVRRETRLDSVG